MRLYLRPITKEDIDLIIAWRNHESVRKFFIFQEDFTRENQLKWFEEHLETKNAFQFIVCEKESDRLIGCTYLRDYSKAHQKAEAGIFLNPQCERQKGYGSEAMELTVEFGFQELKLHKIFARVYEDNLSSRGVFVKNGFEKEACLIDDVCVNKEYRNIVLYGKINPEYKLKG